MMPADRIPGRRELRRLRDVLAEHEARLQVVPESALPQRRLGGAAVGRVLGVGDREPRTPSARQQRGQAVEPLIARSSGEPVGANRTIRPTA